jgi:hypothetical protein
MATRYPTTPVPEVMNILPRLSSNVYFPRPGMMSAMALPVLLRNDMVVVFSVLSCHTVRKKIIGGLRFWCFFVKKEREVV